MTDEECALLLVQRGIIGPGDLATRTLGQELIRRGIVGPEELEPGVPIFDVLRRRGII